MKGVVPWLVDVVFTESPHLPGGTGSRARELLASCLDHRVGPQPPGTFEVGSRAACLPLDLVLCCCLATCVEELNWEERTFRVDVVFQTQWMGSRPS